MRDDAKNLEVIAQAVRSHGETCQFELEAVEMCTLEVDRLGWDAILGVPIRANDEVPTKRFRLVCAGLHGGHDPLEESESAEVEADKRPVRVGELVPA